MGHQWYERLAGRNAEALQFELSRDEPDLASAAGFAGKIVHNRAVKLVAAGDLERVVRAVEAVMSALANNASALERKISLVANLPTNCLYGDESLRVALNLLAKVEAGATCTMDSGIHAAVHFFAEQICHVEGIYRLPRHGLLTTQDLVRDLAIHVETKVAGRLVTYYQESPEGWRTNSWRAPRTEAKRPAKEELEDETKL